MILDTCALLWLAQGGGELSPAAREAIDAAPAVAVCAISAFEIGFKHGKGHLELPAPPRVWFAGVVRHHGLDLLHLDAEVCLRSTELPDLHRDACDRFIIAAALAADRPVVTRDVRFAAYGVRVIG